MTDTMTGGNAGPANGHGVGDHMEHLVRIPGEQWGFWKWVVLRGSGFPANLAPRLSDPECASAADELMEAEAGLEATRSTVLATLSQMLDRLWSEGRWNEDVRRVLVDAVRKIRKGKAPVAGVVSAEVDAGVAALDCALARTASSKDRFLASFASAVETQSEELKQIAASPRFREAVMWQNRAVIKRAFDSFLSSGDSRRRRNRLNEELVASYVQRYSVKNDSIGFFGPIGWATITPDQPSTTATPGPGLLASRNVYFENWGIEAIARSLCDEKALRPWLYPVRRPAITVIGNEVHGPAGCLASIDAPQAAILAACDGLLDARKIASSIIQSFVGLETEADVFDILEGFVDSGYITWSLEMPLVLKPESRLLKFLEGVEDRSLVAPALKTLAEVEAARRHVADAAGDPERLDGALKSLETTFGAATGLATSRSHGRTYAGRTLVYEDCRRDVDIRIGADLLQALARPLSLILDSGRWLTHQLIGACRQPIAQIYEGLVRRTGTSKVRGLDFWPATERFFFGDCKLVVDRAVTDFQGRWLRILGLPKPGRRITYRSDDLRPIVKREFHAPCAGWPGGRYHSPDIMIAADGLDAIRRGEYDLVLGEVHLANNTVCSSTFVSQHPVPEDLFRAITADLPEPRLIPAPPAHLAGLTNRTRVALRSANDYILELFESSGADPKRAVQIASMVMEEEAGVLWFSTRDGQLRFDFMEIFGGVVGGLITDAFRVLASGPYIPRVSIDNLVVCRETWSSPIEELDFTLEKIEEARFLAARRWARGKGMPQMVFVKVPLEKKPFFLDFSSPIYVEMFNKNVRRCLEADSGGNVTISEMLPTPEKTWLVDAEGHRYTAEFRIVAVDTAQAV